MRLGCWGLTMAMSRNPNKPILKYFDYMALDDGAFEFGWSNEDVERFDQLWHEGYPIWDIADILKRDVDEVAILLIDRARRKKVKNRKNGAFGFL